MKEKRKIPSLSTLATLFALIASVTTAHLYFAKQTDLLALADEIKENTNQLNYQAALRTYEFLVKKNAEYPNDKEIEASLKEAQKRLRYYECLLFNQCNP